MTKELLPKWTADEVRAQLSDRYQQPEFALFFEVRNSTGFAANRSADALAMDMYPSRGLAMHGFEIKVSRQDFLKELKDGAKAEAIAQYCNHWWLVAPAEVLRDDLPAGWGWLKPTASGLRMAKSAPLQEAEGVPPHFLAAILRAAHNQSDGQIEAAVAARTSDLKNQITKLNDELIKTQKKLPSGRYSDIHEVIETVETLTGHNLGGWGDNQEFVQAVRAVLAVGPARSYAGAKAVLGAAQRAVVDLEKALAECGLPVDEEGK